MSNGRMFTRQRVVFMIVVLLFGLIMVLISLHIKEGQLRKSFLEHAEFASHCMEWDSISQLSGSDQDLIQPEYLATKAFLARVVQLHPEYRFIYLMGRRPDNQVFFFVDSELEGSQDYSPPGQVYPDPSGILLGAFEDGNPVVEGPVSDQWGRWVSALVPFRNDRSDNIKMLFGVDIDSRQWLRAKMEAVMLPLLLDVLVILSVLGFWLVEENRKSRLDVTACDERLKLSVNKCDFYIQNAIEGIIEVDKTSRVTFINKRVTELIGFTAEEMVGKQIDDFMPISESADHHRKVADRAAGVSGRYERVLLCKDGQTVTVLVSAVPIKDNKGAITGSFAMLVDISALKRAEQSLEKIRQRYRLFIDSTEDLVFLKDAQYKYVLVNKAYQRFLNKPEDEIIGKTDWDLMPDAEAYNCRQSDEKARLADSVIVLKEHVKGGTYEVRKFAVGFEDGSSGVGGIIRDVTGR